MYFMSIAVGWVYCAAIMAIIKKKTALEVFWRRTYVCLPIVFGWVYCAAIMTIIQTRIHSRLCNAIPIYAFQLSLVMVNVQQLRQS